METVNKPHCKFGLKCYRKNPKHFEIYAHPEQTDVKQCGSKRILRNTTSIEKADTRHKVMKQTPLRFLTKKDFSSAPKPVKQVKDEKSDFGESNRMQNDKNKMSFENKKEIKKMYSEENKRNRFSEKKLPVDPNKRDIRNDRELVQNTDLDSVETKFAETKEFVGDLNLKSKPIEEMIKKIFLVDMPPDFYSFYEFYKSVIRSDNLEALKLSKLKLVGPFDILAGEVNYATEEDLVLCHWRFYYDPPEFQTVLASDSGYHIGYWRDDPNENPVFLASNNPNIDCTFKVEAENLFGVFWHYLNELMKRCNPFEKVKITKLQTAVSDWAKENKFSLEKKTNKMIERQKKVVSKTFHKVGIVVPVEAETQLGYRPLVESDENLKRICNLIINASDDNEKESLWENLQSLITAANIANDECDFGNSLELGIDLFCMGSPLFHETIEHLLSTSYSLLNRTEFERIIKAHLKFRRKDNNLSLSN